MLSISYRYIRLLRNKKASAQEKGFEIRAQKERPGQNYKFAGRAGFELRTASVLIRKQL
jgi:hypothetical protein